MRRIGSKLAAILVATLVFFSYEAIRAQDTNLVAEVQATLMKFKAGVESGDTTMAQQLAARGNFSFIGLYNLLAKTYHQAGIAFPMDIGHIKILRDGRAKAETYLNPDKNLFVFTLKKEAGEWKICHLEGIRFPIYDLPQLPYDQIYQLPPETRSWTRAEMELAFESRVYYQLKLDHGEKFAQDFFLDGPGFKIGMDAWLPFIEGAAQFAIYYAILETNHYGSNCVITRASYDEAELQFAPLVKLEVLKRAYFYPKFSWDEYQQLYRRIMDHRASACGLAIEITMNESNCCLIVKKKGDNDF
ncbi:MAG: hypothetical protein ONB16_02855 [candidate division KSB1 bacterium]|nr:hypothetical protein [candidate division KSB1 bacterium]MDZ7342663.1 hypothetical protein [candidate division KSB1 bacterium]